MNKLTLVALGIAALATLPVSAANWSDTYLATSSTEPVQRSGHLRQRSQEPASDSVVYGWDYGTNFFDVNMLGASHQDPDKSLVPSAMPTPMSPATPRSTWSTAATSTWARSSRPHGLRPGARSGLHRRLRLRLQRQLVRLQQEIRGGRAPVRHRHSRASGTSASASAGRELQRLHRAGSGLQDHRRGLDRLVQVLRAGSASRSLKGWPNYIGSKGNRPPGFPPGHRRRDPDGRLPDVATSASAVGREKAAPFTSAPASSSGTTSSVTRTSPIRSDPFGTTTSRSTPHVLPPNSTSRPFDRLVLSSGSAPAPDGRFARPRNPGAPHVRVLPADVPLASGNRRAKPPPVVCRVHERQGLM